MPLISVGDVSVDVYARVPQLPAFGEKLAGQPLGSFCGGVGGNVASAAVRYGQPARVLAAIGRDTLGELSREQTAALGVDTTFLVVRDHADTVWHFVAVSEAGEKALTLLPTDLFFPRFEWFPPEAFDDVTHVHVAPLDMHRAAEFAAHASRLGTTLSVDVEPAALRAGQREAVDEVLGRADVLSVNEYSLDELTRATPAAGARELKARYGAAVVIVTMGERGAVLVDDASAVRVGAAPVTQVVDTTGAGDCFNAVFLCEWLAGSDIATAGARASSAAALSVQGLGSRSAYPTRADVLAHPLPSVEAA